VTRRLLAPGDPKSSGRFLLLVIAPAMKNPIQGILTDMASGLPFFTQLYMESSETAIFPSSLWTYPVFDFWIGLRLTSLNDGPFPLPQSSNYIWYQARVKYPERPVSSTVQVVGGDAVSVAIRGRCVKYC